MGEPTRAPRRVVLVAAVGSPGGAAAYDHPVTFAAIVLFANAVFNAVAWPRFYPRIAADPRARGADGRRTRFYTVHVVLIVIALVLAAVSAITGVVILL